MARFWFQVGLQGLLSLICVYIAPRLTNRKKKYLNTGSYNYLGFAENDGFCSRETIKEIRRTGCGVASPCKEIGLSLKLNLEQSVLKNE